MPWDEATMYPDCYTQSFCAIVAANKEDGTQASRVTCRHCSPRHQHLFCYVQTLLATSSTLILGLLTLNPEP